MQIPHLTESDFEEPRFIHVGRTGPDTPYHKIATITPRLRVKLVIDDDGADPTESTDLFAPMMLKPAERGSVLRVVVETPDDERGLSDVWGWTPNTLLIQQQVIIANRLGILADDHVERCGSRTSDDAGNLVDMFDAYTDNCDLDFRAWVFDEMLGHVVLHKTLHGHSQGDWCEVLLVATPEHVERCGFDPEDRDTIMRSLECDASTYESWRRGDCWGYQVQTLGPDLDPDDAMDDAWEDIEDGACWGFIGDPDKSGILDAVHEALRYPEAAALIEAHHVERTRREEMCKSKHWNDGTDQCADCGAILS